MIFIPKPRTNEFPQEYINHTKVCKFCGVEKPYIEYYYQLKTNKKGEQYYYFTTRCIECEKKAALIWANNNIEKKRESCRKNSYKQNIREYHKMNSQRQRDTGYRKQYEKDNPEMFKKYAEDRRHKAHKITDSEWIECKKYFNYQCAYCGITEEEHYAKYKERLHKEHVESEGSIYLDNCVPACKSCNSSKGTATLEEWYNQDKPFYSELRLKKISKWRTEEHKKYMVTVPA